MLPSLPSTIVRGALTAAFTASFVCLAHATPPSSPTFRSTHTAPCDEEADPAPQLDKFWKSYLSVNRRWELYRESELTRSSRAGPGRNLARTLRTWQRGTLRKGRAADDAIDAIRSAAVEPVPEALAAQVLTYVEIVELLHASTKSATHDEILTLLEIASFTEALNDKQLDRLASQRPRLIEREAGRALRRIVAKDLLRHLFDTLNRPTSKRARPSRRKALQLLGDLAADKSRSRAALDRIADECVDTIAHSGDTALQIAATSALKKLSDEQPRFRLGDRRRDQILDYLEADIRRGDATVLILVLRLIGVHPDRASLGRLAQLAADNSRLPERIDDTLWATLKSISPASIPRSAGGQAWLEWFAREKDQPRLAHWLQQNQRGAKPAADPHYAGARFYGIPIVGRSVVFVIDVSGSMAQPLGGTQGDIKIEGAKKELLKAVEALNDPSLFNIVTFETDVDVWQRKLVVAKASRKRGMDYVSALQARGGTNLHGGLLAALGLRDADRRTAVTGLKLPEQIILLSDGNPSAGILTAADDILADLDRIDPGHLTRIDTIAFGRGADRRFLKALADRFGGEMSRVD